MIAGVMKCAVFALMAAAVLLLGGCACTPHTAPVAEPALMPGNPQPSDTPQAYAGRERYTPLRQAEATWYPRSYDPYYDRPTGRVCPPLYINRMPRIRRHVGRGR